MGIWTLYWHQEKQGKKVLLAPPLTQIRSQGSVKPEKELKH